MSSVTTPLARWFSPLRVKLAGAGPQRTRRLILTAGAGIARSRLVAWDGGLGQAGIWDANLCGLSSIAPRRVRRRDIYRMRPGAVARLDGRLVYAVCVKAGTRESANPVAAGIGVAVPKGRKGRRGVIWLNPDPAELEYLTGEECAKQLREVVDEGMEARGYTSDTYDYADAVACSPAEAAPDGMARVATAAAVFANSRDWRLYRHLVEPVFPQARWWQRGRRRGSA